MVSFASSSSRGVTGKRSVRTCSRTSAVGCRLSSTSVTLDAASRTNASLSRGACSKLMTAPLVRRGHEARPGRRAARPWIVSSCAARIELVPDIAARRERAGRDHVDDRHHRRRCFRVDRDRDPRAGLALRRPQRARRTGRRQRAELVANARLDRRDVDIADDDHGHAIGAIPVAVEAHDRVARCGLDDVGRPDHVAIRVARPREHGPELLIERPAPGPDRLVPLS